MTLTKLLGNTGLACCILGVAGIGGYFDLGTGLIASVTLFVIGVICFYFYIKEGGTHEEE